jgi:WD40 repeat protein
VNGWPKLLHRWQWGLWVFILLWVASSPAKAQDLYNHPELKWRSLTTEHFVVHFADGLDSVAALAAKIAEEIHEPLCQLYDYHPDGKVSLIFQDTDDISNAASYFMNNKIFFWTTAMDWDLRGTHHWLRNVVTHEYTHMIQLGASRKWSRRVPSGYFQWMDYEPERRPDVLYGYPNRVASYPYPAVTIPAWFAEGTAQFQLTGRTYDFWDSHRDMLLRSATLSGRLLSYEEMGYFGKTSLESEMVYNQGFSLTKYIADHAGGPEALSKISAGMKSPFPIAFNRALKKATGKSGNEWYRLWKAHLEQEYSALQNRITPTVAPTDTVPTTGSVNLFPRLSPDGRSVAFISNQGRDYESQSSLYLYDVETKKVKKLTGSVQGALCWLRDGKGIVFSRRALNSQTGSLQFDLYLYLLAEEKEIRLTKGLRAESPDLCPDGKTLAFTINEGGNRDLTLMPMPSDYLSKKFKPLSQEAVVCRHRGGSGTQYYHPRWSPDGRKLVAASSEREGRDVCIFGVTPSADSLWLEKIISGQNMELRDPAFCEDGNHLAVAFDNSGVSNIYRMNLETDVREPLTSVIGGAYYPDFREGKLAFCDFTGRGFRICVIQHPEPLKLPAEHLDHETYASQVPEPTYDNRFQVPEVTSYKPRFDNLYWFPRIMIDYGTVKPGTYVWLTDILGKLDFIGGFAINSKKDYDLYGQVEYRVLYPTVFAEIYNMQRRLSEHFADSTRIIGESGSEPIYDRYRIRYRYNLTEVDAGIKWPLGKSSYLKMAGIYDRYTAYNRFDDGTTVALTYFKGMSAQLSYYTDQVRRQVDSPINPSAGYYGFLRCTRANQKFFTGFRIDADKFTLVEVYEPYNYDLFEGGFEKYFSLPFGSHAFALRFQGGWIDETVDPFFYIFAGGLPGMRGYSYYSLGGERTAVATTTYRFPIVKRAGWSLYPLSVNRIYGNFFCDVGDAWVGDFESGRLKKDVGAGLRIQMHSFYSYPTALSLDVAYGFDRFTHREEDFEATYGKEWRYYVTVLFDFYNPFTERIAEGISLR